LPAVHRCDRARGHADAVGASGSAVGEDADRRQVRAAA
jgi:predicted TIM-barrel enzyme